MEEISNYSGPKLIITKKKHKKEGDNSSRLPDDAEN